MADEPFEGWALVEQMGFRKTVGKVREIEMFGTKLLRLDVPVPGLNEWTTRYCGGPSLYQVTPLSEAVALDMAKRQGDPRPVHPTDYRLADQRVDANGDGALADEELDL
jgi:hypothetical protein